MTKRRKLLKKLKKSSAVKEAMELDYNKDGSAIINVGLIEAEDIFSPFAYKTYELLDCDVVDYINTYEKSIPLSDDLSIDVYTEEAMKLKKPVILIIKITGFLLINITTVQPQLDRFLANPVSPLHYQIHAAA